MLRKMLLPAALAAVMIGKAEAQMTNPGFVDPRFQLPPVNTTLPTVNPTLPPVNPGLVSPFGTTTPGFGFFDPRPVDATGAALGFTPGLTPSNTFIPGTGGGFSFVGPWGWGYNGPLVDNRADWLRGSINFPRPGGLPVAGVNTPPLGRGPRRAAIRDSTGGAFRVAGRRQEYNAANTPNGLGERTINRGPSREDRFNGAVVNVAEISPKQVRLAGRMEDLMENRPMIEGTITGRSNGGLLVRFESRGELRTQRFPAGEVFAFHGARLASGSTDRIAVGTGVLVPEPVTVRTYRQSVAGSRQTTRRRIAR
jgi:hypothetical protein